MAEKIGRDGRVSKRGLGPVAVNGGMYHLRNGQLIAGISKTQAQHPLDDLPMIHQPVVSKNLAPIEINPGCRSRRDDPLN